MAEHGAALKSDVLLVPHHGSKTSSTALFLDVVAPGTALVQAGFRNRFGHPAPPVVERYAARGIELVDSASCGAWTWRDGAGHVRATAPGALLASSAVAAGSAVTAALSKRTVPCFNSSHESCIIR